MRYYHLNIPDLVLSFHNFASGFHVSWQSIKLYVYCLDLQIACLFTAFYTSF